MDSLSRELDDLRRCNKRLADDKALLESQFLATEDTIFTLAKENEELSDLNKLPAETILIRWMNFHLRNAEQKEI